MIDRGVRLKAEKVSLGGGKMDFRLLSVARNDISLAYDEVDWALERAAAQDGSVMLIVSSVPMVVVSVAMTEVEVLPEVLPEVPPASVFSFFEGDSFRTAPTAPPAPASAPAFTPSPSFSVPSTFLLYGLFTSDDDEDDDGLAGSEDTWMGFFFTPVKKEAREDCFGALILQPKK